MNIDILHRPTALENLLAGRMRSLGGRIWPAGRRLPMHVLSNQRFRVIFFWCWSWPRICFVNSSVYKITKTSWTSSAEPMSMLRLEETKLVG